jgi:integrase
MPKIRGVYKRGNIWWIRYNGPDGILRRESTGDGTKHREAINILTQRRQAVLEGKDPLLMMRAKSNTFEELKDQYAEWIERQKNYYTKVRIVNKLFEHFRDLPLNQFNTLIVERYQTKLINEKKAPATNNRYIAVLKHMFTKAVDWDMTDGEVLRRVRKAKLLPEENTRLRYLSFEECRTLIKACSPHLKPIVITALNTGMRKEEILSLRWYKNIDLHHGFILLEVTKNGDRREIPINKTLLVTLKELQKNKQSPYVFADKYGRRYKDVKKSFRTALIKAGICDFRFHDIRHTFASQLIMSGVDLTTAKEILGHKSVSMTLRYAHLAPSHKVHALNHLDNKMNNVPTAQLLHSKPEKGKSKIA